MDQTDVDIIWKILRMTDFEFRLFIENLTPKNREYLDVILENYEGELEQ